MDTLGCTGCLSATIWSRREELNAPSTEYNSVALTLSYTGVAQTTSLMPRSSLDPATIPDAGSERRHTVYDFAYLQRRPQQTRRQNPGQAAMQPTSEGTFASKRQCHIVARKIETCESVPSLEFHQWCA